MSKTAVAKKLSERVAKANWKDDLLSYLRTGGLTDDAYKKVEESVKAAKKVVPKVIKGEQPMYRIAPRDRIFQKVDTEPHADSSPLQPGGIYFGLKPNDLQVLMDPDLTTSIGKGSAKEFLKHQAETSDMMPWQHVMGKGKFLKDAKVLDASDQGVWDGILQEYYNGKVPYTDNNYGQLRAGKKEMSRGLTAWLKKRYDAVVFPDQESVTSPSALQVVVLNPGKVRMKMGKTSKIIGTGAAAALGGALGALEPDEAEAMPAGVFEKLVVKGGERASSAARTLIGRTVQGKKIANVLKAQGPWRKIVFEDETMMVVEKQYINDLARTIGTKDYVGKFREASEESKTNQALKSLMMREKQAEKTPFSRESFRGMHERHVKRALEFGEEVEKTVFVQRKGNYFQMPEDYAKHLEGMGLLKIVTGKQEKKILERLGATKPGPKKTPPTKKDK